jgi:hypothetical protein
MPFAAYRPSNDQAPKASLVFSSAVFEMRLYGRVAEVVEIARRRNLRVI